MASRFDKIKGITIEIGGDTTKLSQALKDVNKDLKDTQSDLKDIERLLKMDPGNIDLMRQKHEALGRQIKDSKDKLDKLKTAQSEMNKIDTFTPEQQSQYDALQREIFETEEKIKSLEKEYKGSTVFSALGNTFSAAGEKMESAGKKLLPVTGVLTGLATGAVKTTADFDTAMSQVASVSGATGEDFDALRDKAREMGASTKFSAAEAAEAMNYMAMAGWKTEDMLGGIEGIMNLAAASGEDLATTSDIVTDALTAFGLSADDSGHFADVLAAASSNANTNVSMLGESFKYVAPVAGTLGFSAEDTSIALGLMANSGIKASQAGTALRTSLSNLAKPTESMQTTMDQLGISLTDEQGNVKSLRDVMDNLRQSMKVNADGVNHYRMEQEALTNHTAVSKEQIAALTGAERDRAIQIGVGSDLLEQMSEDEYALAVQQALGTDVMLDRKLTAEEYNTVCQMLGQQELKFGEAEQAAAASTIFGKNAMAGMLAVVNASEEDYQKLTGAIDGCGGTTEQMAAIMQDNLAGQLTILQSQLQELAISFGDLLMPVVREVVGWIQKFVDWLNNLDEPTKETILKIGLLVAALGPVLIALGKLSSGIGAILQHPVLAIIGLVIAAIAGLYATNEDFRNALNTFFTETLIPLGQYLAGKFKDAWEWLTNFWKETLQPALTNLWNNFQKLKNDYLVPLVDYIKNFVIKRFKDLKNFWTETLQPALAVLWGKIQTFKNDYLVPLVDYLKNFVIKRFKDLVTFWTETLQPKLADLWGKIQTFKNDYLVPLVDYLKNFVIKKFKDLAAFWTDKLQPGIEALWDKFQTFKNNYLIPLVDYLKNNVIKKFKDLYGYWEDTLKPGIEALWNKFQTFKNEYLVPLVDYLKNYIIKYFKRLSTFWTETLQPALEILWGKINTFRVDYLAPLADFLKNYIIKYFKKLASLWTDTLQPALETLWGKIQTFKNDYLKPLWEFLDQSVIDVFRRLYRFWVFTLKPQIDSLGQKFSDFKEKYLMPVYNWIDGTFLQTIRDIKAVLASVKTYLTCIFQGDWEKVWDDISGVFKNTWAGFVNIAREPINKVIGFVNDMINGVETGLNFIIGGLNKISFTIPDWVPGIGGNGFGINISPVSWERIPIIPEMAKGGILQNGQAIVAEAGPELITMQGNRAMVQPLTNTANNYNAGGITLNIYQQPGQNVNDLADLIMDRMDEVYTMKGAVFA